MELGLTGRVALVTGGYSGLGLATTRALAGAGAHVVVPARRPAAARQALEGIESVQVDEIDLADLDSVRRFVARFLATGRTIDILIADARVMACRETRVGPGWEAQFATNHLGHYALVNGLWPALAGGEGARVVVVSSGIDWSASIRWDDVHFPAGLRRSGRHTGSRSSPMCSSQPSSTCWRDRPACSVLGEPRRSSPRCSGT